MSAGRPPGAAPVRVGPADVGARVVLRRTLAEGGLTDVLGHLVRWSGGTVAVRTRTGTVVELAEADLVAGKRVPDAPPARRGAPR